MGLVSELRRRNVLRMAVLYAVAAWLIMQVAEVVLDLANLPNWIGPTILGLLAVGFPIALIFSWFYELTPEGISLEKDVDRSESITHVTGRRLDIIVISLLCAAVILFAYDKWWIGGPEQQSIAVLPFTFLGPDQDSEYFADAMTDELIGRLGRIDAVQIKSRLSVARFKDSEQSVNDIAAELDVNFVLEGSVRKAEDRVRVTAQLTDASSGFQEWSDVFNGESDDWFTLHEDMAVRIADALNLHLSPGEVDSIRAHYTENRQAYDAFWRGWLLLESFHTDVSHPEEKIRAAENHLQRALKLDPNYPLAIAGLALANSYYYFYWVDRSAERRERGIELARRALAIDPDLAEGRVALGVAFGTEDNHASAVAEFKKALAHQSEDAMTWCLLAFSCIAQDPPDLKAAEEAARISIRHDPTWTYSYQILGWTLLLQGRYEESAEAYQRGVEFNPDYFAVQFGLGEAHLELGNFDRALDAFEAARELDESSDTLVYIAACYAGLGDIDKALATLEQGLELGFGPIDAVERSPYFTPLRGDPRFAALVESFAGQ